MKVAIYGNGQLGQGVARILSARPETSVHGPATRTERTKVLRSGADVVIIATTSFFADVADDIAEAVGAGSNVICSAEEAAYPWEADPARAHHIDTLARDHGVTVIGSGLNPGFAFDAFVVTATGPSVTVRGITVERTVDLSGFGATVLRRLGIGFADDEFRDGVANATIFGHIGFPQSMRVVAGALGRTIDHITPSIEPMLATDPLSHAAVAVGPGDSAGFRQRYVGYVNGQPWFEARFNGHIAPDHVGLAPRDEVWISGEPDLHYVIDPGLQPQLGSAAVIANSLARVVEARPGWQLTPDLPPARPPAFDRPRW